MEIDTPDIEPNQGLVELPVQLTEAQVVQACQPGGSQNVSEFVVTGRGGLPPAPSNSLNSDAVWIDLDSTAGLAENTPSSSQATYHKTNSTAQPLLEATGWAFDNKGEVVLIAATPTATPDSLGLNGLCYIR